MDDGGLIDDSCIGFILVRKFYNTNKNKAVGMPYVIVIIFSLA